jgi:DNA-binding Lrp family transcriptional regulator
MPAVSPPDAAPATGGSAAPAPVDALDLRLLDALRHDGRATFEALARAVGLSRPATRDRLQRLLSGGVVQVTGVVHPSVFGLDAYAHAAVRVEGPALPVARRIAQCPEVPFVTVTSGRFAIVAEVRTTDQAALAAMLRRIAALPGVRGLATAVYTEILTDAHFPPQPYTAAAVDELDRRLLAELRRDGRAAFADLGAAVGLSTSAARTRVLRLLDSGAVHVGARVNTNALGLAQLTGFQLTLGGGAADAVAAVRDLPQVQYLATAVGRADVIGSLVTYAAEDTLRVLDAVRAVPGVHDTESWTHLSVVKEQYDHSPLT